MAWGRNLLMRLFGRPKGLLGRLGGLMMARMNRDAAVEVIGLLGVRSDDSLLEIGFGPGVAIQLLVERVPGVRIAGVDPSLEMLSQASARNAAALRSRRVDLRHGVVDALPFAAQTFDKALAINSMQVWPDPAAGLSEIGRVLKPAGRIGLGFTANSGQPKEGVAAALAAAGFVDSQIVERPRLFCAIATKP
ncbi:MAG TPA: class I SAM-dependent methyltransferase [Hyphomicrobiaceae bacterium]|nr:class I SAM-dependent methyltransferase [Hyphomicrobiaceae bacterium]